MFAVNFYNLLPTLAAGGAGQSGYRLLSTQLTQQRPLLRLQRPTMTLVDAVSNRGRGGGHQRLVMLGFAEVGVVTTAVVPSWLERRELFDLIGRFFSYALRLNRLVFAVRNQPMLALGSGGEVAVAVDRVKVFGDGVLVVVAVQTELLFGTKGMGVDVL